MGKELLLAGKGNGVTNYRIEAGRRIEADDPDRAEEVHHKVATGRVSGGYDRFKIFGGLESIAADNPDNVHVTYDDGSPTPMNVSGREITFEPLPTTTPDETETVQQPSTTSTGSTSTGSTSPPEETGGASAVESLAGDRKRLLVALAAAAAVAWGLAD